MGRLGLAEAAEDAVRRRSGRRPRPRRPAPARSCGDDARSASGHASCTRVLAGEARRSDRHSLSRADPPGPLHGRERDPARPLAARTGRRDRRRPARTRPRQPVQPGQRRHVGDARHAPRRAADARLDRRGALGRRCASDRGGAPRRPGRRRPVGERAPRAALRGLGPFHGAAGNVLVLGLEDLGDVLATRRSSRTVWPTGPRLSATTSYSPSGAPARRES